VATSQTTDDPGDRPFDFAQDRRRPYNINDVGPPQVGGPLCPPAITDGVRIPPCVPLGKFRVDLPEDSTNIAVP
jgi:hypothetical protein